MEVYDKIKYLHDRLVKCQANIDAIKRSINSWGKVPLYQRKDHYPKALLQMEPHDEIMANRTAEAAVTAMLINRLLYENVKLFFDLPRRYLLADKEEEENGDEVDDNVKRKDYPKVIATLIAAQQFGETDEDEDEEEELYTSLHRQELLQAVSQEERELFREYEKYVDVEIGDQLLDAVITSVTYLRMEIENRYDNDFPVFEIFMELQEPHVVYFLNLDPTSKNGFTFQVESLLDDMYSMVKMLQRTAQDPSDDVEPETFTGRNYFFFVIYFIYVTILL